MQTRTVLYCVLFIQLSTLVAVVFNVFGARQVFGFLYLSFIPGFLILKIFKSDNVGIIKTIIFSVGISLAFLMFLGLMFNTLYPILGLPNPLSAFNILASVFGIVLILYLIWWWRCRGLSNSSVTSFKFSPVVALLISIPFVTVIGTILANISDNTAILMLLVLITSLVVICAFAKGLIPSEIYPLAILAISFFLLFHVSLISNYLIGADVHTEYYFAQLTSVNSIWNSTISYPYNGMLSVTILPVIYSGFLNMDINWVYKIVYPMIFLLVPLTLYLAYRRQTSPLIAFLSVFFFVSFDTFYVQMLGLAREMIAEVFFALLIVLIVEEKMSLTQRRLLFIVFSAALIVSHYALAYIFMFYILITPFLSHFFKRTNDKSIPVITGSMIVGYVVMTFSWDLFVSPASFQSLTSTLGYIYRAVQLYVLGPGVGGLLPGYTSPIHEVGTYVFLLPQLLIVIGIIGLILKRKQSQFNQEYSSMSVTSLSILLMAIFLPKFAAGLNMSRFYHIALFFLAPFCVIGGILILGSIANIKSRFFSASRKFNWAIYDYVKKPWLFLIAVLLISLFLFQVGFIYEITGDVPTSISLSKDRMNSWTIYMNQLYVDEQEVIASKWLSKYENNKSMIYADAGPNRYLTSYGLIPLERVSIMDPKIQKETSGWSYFFFGRLSVVNNEIVGYNAVWNNTDFSYILNNTNKIYSSGASDIYCSP